MQTAKMSSPSKRTHRFVNKPQISVKFLADYMAASERARRTLIRNCKYQPIARIVQHEEAKIAIAAFIRRGTGDINELHESARLLRVRQTTDEFERHLLDYNADYIERFATVYPDFALPNADILPAGQVQPISLNGVKITTELAFRLHRVTKNNKGRNGGAMFRYAKGKPLTAEIATWQSAFIIGWLTKMPFDEIDEPEARLCLTIDAYTGKCYPAPSDFTSRFQNMEAACATIAERWDNIEPPPKAVF